MYRFCVFIFFVAAGLSTTAQTYIELLEKHYQLFSEGKFSEAIPNASKLIDAAKREYGDRSTTYASSLAYMASLHNNLDNYRVAEDLYKQASVIYQTILTETSPTFDKSLYATNLSDLAGVYLKMGNYAAAEPLYKQALAITKKVEGDQSGNYAAVLNGLGMLYTTVANYTAAEPLFKEALAIRKKEGGEDNPLCAPILNNLGSLYEHMSDYAAAEPLYKQASIIVKKLFGEDHFLYAVNLNNLAGLYKKMGNYKEAEALFKQALAIRKKQLGEKHPTYAEGLNNLANLFLISGDYAAAEPLFKEALTIYKAALPETDPDYISVLSNLAYLYKTTRNYALAETLNKQALEIRKRVLGDEHPDYAISLVNLAALYQDMGNYKAAEPLFKQALAIYKKISGEQSPDYAVTLSNLAALYEAKGNYPQAASDLNMGTTLKFNHIEKNFITLSEAEKLQWWESERGNFQTSPSLLFTDRHASATFLQQVCTQQLKLKGFVLNDGTKVLKEARKKGNPQLQQLLNQWQNNKATLAKQYSLPVVKRIPQLDSLEKATNNLEKEISTQSAVFRNSREKQHIDFAAVSAALRQAEAAVEFIRFEYYHKRWTDSTFYAAFVILPNDTLPHFATLCEERQLARLLDSKASSSMQFVKQLYRGTTVSNNSQAGGEKGDSLYNLVWKPLLPWLKGIKKISIAPAGLLNRIAFNALPVDSSHYLIDKYQLRQYSSVRQIVEKQIRVTSAGTMLDAILYGGIAFNVSGTPPGKQEVSNKLPDDVKRSINAGSWDSLPGTLQEVSTIDLLFKNKKKPVKVITGEAATEESLKALNGQAPTVLHLATHGFSLPDVGQKRRDIVSNNDNQFTLADNPLMRSGIIMAGANRVWGGAEALAGKEDGIVTAYEISNLDLSNTELVVLSACETGLGDIRGTEGVFGLQRAFKLAGVQNMILSLWQVPDKETAELMNLLYTNILEGMDTYEAFHKTQDSMHKKYPPYYWAAFVLIE